MSAQFYVTGDDPGRLKWNYIDTDSYRIIYPSESDSLAHVYARKLEKFKVPVSRSSGYITGEGDGKLMPVVLHTYNGSNGSVAWAPKRMDLFTIPSAYEPKALPWEQMLAIHESRHVTQMQFGMTKALKPFNWICCFADLPAFWPHEAVTKRITIRYVMNFLIFWEYIYTIQKYEVLI